MKKILFLTFAYPYGHFGPSDFCSAQIIESLVKSGKYEVHNVSCKGEKGQKPNYELIDGVITHFLPFPEKIDDYSKRLTRIRFRLVKFFYPVFNIWKDLKYYYSCRRLIQKESYDLVIAQRNPEESIMTGVLLKRSGLIHNLMVIFWDKIYGDLPDNEKKQGFALKRTRKFESWIARYADILISLYPLKSFHEQYGELRNAKGKRFYLGIPYIKPPKSSTGSYDETYIIPGMINILFSGTIFHSENMQYMVDLLNQTNFVEKVNLLFFCRGIGKNDADNFKKIFRGNILFSDWIPHDELINLYNYVDAFISFPGNITSIRSKNFDYAVYGKPIILLYNNKSDVNVLTFSRYPACILIDMRKPVAMNVEFFESHFSKCLGKTIPFEEVESLFPYDTASAYVKLISAYVDH